jgi:putative FmdB family regulatory protein
MPLYEFRCRTCDETFELRRPMSEASSPASCPSGHPGAVRLLSVFASVGANGAGAPTRSTGPTPSVAGSGGGCGVSCGCHH